MSDAMLFQQGNQAGVLCAEFDALLLSIDELLVE